MSGKSMPKAVNDELRKIVQTVSSELGTSETARRMKVSQGYLSDFLDGNRGGGFKLLVGIGRVAPGPLMRILGVADFQTTGEEVVDVKRLPPASIDANDPEGVEELFLPPRVPTEVARVARGILLKRGWTDEEIEAGKNRATVLTDEDALDAIAVADAWELPLRGARTS